MDDFTLDPERYLRVREEMKQLDHPLPNPLQVRGEVENLLVSASKASRALIQADSAQSMLTYHACNLERHLDDLVQTGYSAVLSDEDRARLTHSIALTAARLRRTELYAHECRLSHLARLEHQLQQLQEIDEDCFVVNFH